SLPEARNWEMSSRCSFGSLLKKLTVCIPFPGPGLSKSCAWQQNAIHLHPRYLICRWEIAECAKHARPSAATSLDAWDMILWNLSDLNNFPKRLPPSTVNSRI